MVIIYTKDITTEIQGFVLRDNIHSNARSSNNDDVFFNSLSFCLKDALSNIRLLLYDCVIRNHQNGYFMKKLVFCESH